MSDAEALAGFIDKWRARWPEWRVAEVFVPVASRESTLAWLALRQELADAAWSGADPAPGAAKLAWWSEELHGWTHGRRRHPLGLALQRIAAPWDALGDALPAFTAARTVPLSASDGPGQLHTALAPFVVAAGAVSAAIAADPVGATASRGGGANALAASLCAVRALAGEGSPAFAEALLDAWPARPAGTRADRIDAALARQRLGNGNLAPSQWHTLWAAWRAGRSFPRA